MLQLRDITYVQWRRRRWATLAWLRMIMRLGRRMRRGRTRSGSEWPRAGGGRSGARRTGARKGWLMYSRVRTNPCVGTFCLIDQDSTMFCKGTQK